jgi:hypothetical protein
LAVAQTVYARMLASERDKMAALLTDCMPDVMASCAELSDIILDVNHMLQPLLTEQKVSDLEYRATVRIELTHVYTFKD